VRAGSPAHRVKVACGDREPAITDEPGLVLAGEVAPTACALPTPGSIDAGTTERDGSEVGPRASSKHLVGECDLYPGGAVLLWQC
jgi:hypothetical protein